MTEEIHNLTERLELVIADVADIKRTLRSSSAAHWCDEAVRFIRQAQITLYWIDGEEQRWEAVDETTR